MNILSLIPVELIRIVIAIVALAAFVGLNGLVLVYFERKIAGHIQRRPGPYEVGPWGTLQPLVDAVKLIGKQLFMPLRQAITGMDRGPDMPSLLLLVGPDKVKKRLSAHEKAA